MDKNTLLLFDVDGTLTRARQVIDPEMYKFIVEEVKPKFSIGIVGGSDIEKILEQMGGNRDFDYIFSENGLVSFHKGEQISSESIQKHFGDDKLQEFINFTLRYLSEIKLPRKRGNFIEFRTGMINVCPVGRSCTQVERDEFFLYDKEHKIRETLVQNLKSQFPDFGLRFSIGGQISVDVFPNGWDKTYCLKFVEDIYKTIHFFGDKTNPDENDYEIYKDERTIGHSVKSFEETKNILQEFI